MATATSSKAPSSSPMKPVPLTAVVTNTAIATAIRPYSIAVTPGFVAQLSGKNPDLTIYQILPLTLATL